ncbi:MAG: putative DCC family thiol-disulfide oxidoreductase YuxK [Glaciecola sp.]|jgi:predicted DCC family thiol-disulfide oxidoreductase YuxK
MIIFYDARCPLCNAEMKQLKKADVKEKITLEDLNATDFSERFPNVDKNSAMAILQAQNQAGDMIFGLDVTHQAWKTVGKHRWLFILRLPVIRIFADMGYRFFAKYRQPISRLLMPNTPCEDNSCSLKSKNDR